MLTNSDSPFSMLYQVTSESVPSRIAAMIEESNPPEIRREIG